MSNNALTTVLAKSLPALSGSSLTYNPEKNVFLTMGYSTSAGCYYRAIRLSNRLAVYYDLGEGFCRTFLNGISLYLGDGKRFHLIAQKKWGGCDNYRFFSESMAKEESILMMKNFLAGQAKAMGYNIADSQLLSFSRDMIEETQQKQLR